VLVDPRRIAENKYEMASFLEGMEKAGIGQYITLAQLVEEGLVVDLFVTGSWVVSRQGKQIWRNDGMLKLQWLLLADRGVLRNETPGITVVHSCQVLDEEEAQSIITLRDHGDDIQCDYVITPEQIIRTEDAQRPNVTKPWLENLSDELTHSTPPVQELKGIKMMEKIMGSTGLPKATEADKPKMPQPEEEMGVDMVTRIMRGYKV
jgi:5-formyltetrahydrofolate cyclo-ligase